MAILFEGTAQTNSNPAASRTVTISTTGGNRLILVHALCNGGPVTSVTSANLTFNRWGRSDSGSTTVEVWYAVASSSLSSEVITVNQTSSAYITVCATAAYSGSGLDIDFDPDATNPTVGTANTSGTISTATADARIIGLYRSNASATTTPAATWTGIDSNQFIMVEYKDFTATQSALSVPVMTNTGTNGWVIYAIIESSGGNVYNDTTSDTATATESFSASATFVTTISDSVTATEAFAAGLVMPESISDSVVSSDALTESAVFNPAVSDSVAGSDTMDASAVFNPNLTDDVQATETMEAAAAVNTSISDSVTGTDALAAEATFEAETEDSVEAEDALTGGVVWIGAISDSVEASSIMGAAMVFTLSTSDSVEGDDSLEVTAVFNPAFSDTVLGVDSFTLGTVYFDSFTDSVLSTDTMSANMGIPNYILQGWIH
jgi:hypothetical protein